MGTDAGDTKTRILVVDSRDRDRALYPAPSKYVVELPDDVYDVVAVRLLAADVPFASYVVNAHNRTVPVSVAGAPTAAAAVEPGDYADPQDMCQALAAALAAATGAAFAVSYPATPGADSYAISAPQPFELRFAEAPRGASLARVLGFDDGATYASSPAAGGGHALRAPFRRDGSRDRYVVLDINGMDLLHSANNATHRTFAVLPGKFIDMNIDAGDDGDYAKEYAPPLARMSRVAVQFSDYYGRPYDFQNQDHRLNLQVTYMPRRKYGM